MLILAIDPGPKQSAWVFYNSERIRVLEYEKESNETLLERLPGFPGYITLVIEKVASYGRPVGEEVFETVFWSGRFAQAYLGNHDRIDRRTIKRFLCGSENKVNDAVIRQRLIDIFGGKDAAIGCKKTPGPLYGLKADMWAALAVAYTYAGMHEDNQH